MTSTNQRQTCGDHWRFSCPKVFWGALLPFVLGALFGVLFFVPLGVQAHGAANLHIMTDSGTDQHAGQVPERGHASIKILRHSQTLSIEWLVSAWSVLGFEGLPTTQVEHKLWSQSLGLLFNPKALWIFNEKAQCYPLEAIVTSPLLMNEAMMHQAPSKMYAGGHASATQSTHADINREKPHDGGVVPHHHHAQNAQALEGFFRGWYTFRCVKMAQLTQLDIMVFDQFPALKSAKVALEAGGWVAQKPQHMVMMPSENTLAFE